MLINDFPILRAAFVRTLLLLDDPFARHVNNGNADAFTGLPNVQFR